MNKSAVTKSGKSLFSINVQDDIMQTIFKEMKDEIDALKHKVNFLTDEVATRPSVEDYRRLVNITRELQEQNKVNETQIKSFLDEEKNDIKKFIEETKKEVKEQMNDTTISVNGVIRAHNVLIDKKVFEMTRPTFEFNEMKRSVASVVANEGEIEKKLKRLFDFVTSFLQEPFPVEGKARMPLDGIFKEKLAEDREQVKTLESHARKLDSRVEKIETMFFRIADLTKAELPQYESAPKVHFKDNPKLPKLESPKAFTDYFKYLMNVVPANQKILSCYRKEIELIKSALGSTTIEEIEQRRKDQEKQMQEFVKADEFDTVKRQIADISSTFLLKEDFKVVQTDIRNLKEVTVDKDEFDATFDKMTQSIQEVDQKASEGIKNLETAIAEAKTKIPQMPAYTEVKGKPNTAFNILYSGNYDNQRKSSSRSNMTSSRSNRSSGRAALLPRIKMPPSVSVKGNMM